jgi:hypothetical protein
MFKNRPSMPRGAHDTARSAELQKTYLVVVHYHACDVWAYVVHDVRSAAKAEFLRAFTCDAGKMEKSHEQKTERWIATSGKKHSIHPIYNTHTDISILPNTMPRAPHLNASISAISLTASAVKINGRPPLPSSPAVPSPSSSSPSTKQIQSSIRMPMPQKWRGNRSSPTGT